MISTLMLMTMFVSNAVQFITGLELWLYILVLLICHHCQPLLPEELPSPRILQAI